MEYLDVDSPLHRLNPLTKLAGLLAFFILGGLFSNLIFLLLLSCGIGLLFTLAGANRVLKMYLKIILVACLVMMVLQLLFAHDGQELVRFVPRRIPVLGWLGAIHHDSLLFGLVMCARMAVFGLALPLLLSTTQSRDLVLTLVERLKCPYQYAFMFVTSLRFVPTLFLEVENIVQAQKARAFEMRSKNPVRQVKAYLPLITPLVMIALQKAERLAVAMETRGYGLGPRTYLQQHHFQKRDLAVVATLLVLICGALGLRLTGFLN